MTRDARDSPTRVPVRPDHPDREEGRERPVVAPADAAPLLVED